MHRRGIVLLVPLTLLLTAAGGRVVTRHSESAEQYVKAAAKALGSARSVRISGSISTSGVEHVDLVLFANGDLAGNVTVDGEVMQVRVVNGTDYFQAPAAYWEKVSKLPTATAKKLARYWVSTPNSGSSGFGTSLDIKPLAAQLGAAPGLSIVGHETVDGRAAVGVKSSRGGVLWIATSGTPYPIEEVEPGSGGGSLTFSGWNSFGLPTPPKQAVALSSFGS